MQKTVFLTFLTIVLCCTSFQSFECATRKSWKRNGVHRPENGEKTQLVQSAAFKTNKVDERSDISSNEISTEESLQSSSDEGNSSTETVLNNPDISNEQIDSAANSSSTDRNSAQEESDSIENETKSPENSTKLTFEDEIANISLDSDAVNVTFSEQNLKDIFTGSK